MNPKLSIIVTSPSISRLPDISTLIDSLESQGERDFEFIFVAENSPELLERVEEYCIGKGVRGSFVVNDGAKGLSGGRNVGIQHSKAPLVAMIDDDVILPSSWVGAVISTLNDDPGAIGMTGPAYPLWESGNLAWLPIEFYWLISCTGWIKFANPRDVRSAWGMNMAFRREAFDIAGRLFDLSGYHKPVAEDLEFSLRLRTVSERRIVFSERAYLWHKVHPYRVSPRFVSERSRHIGTSRYVLKKMRVDLDRERSLLIRTVRNIPRSLSNCRGNRTRLVTLYALVVYSVVLGYLIAASGIDHETDVFLKASEVIVQTNQHTA